MHENLLLIALRSGVCFLAETCQTVHNRGCILRLPISELRNQEIVYSRESKLKLLLRGLESTPYVPQALRTEWKIAPCFLLDFALPEEATCNIAGLVECKVWKSLWLTQDSLFVLSATRADCISPN